MHSYFLFTVSFQQLKAQLQEAKAKAKENADAIEQHYQVGSLHLFLHWLID